MEKIFKIEERGSSVRTEVIAGVTTFLAMAYIIFVNPAILSMAGMDKGALITVTCLATAIGTFLSAFLGNVPIAMAPGMGLNAFFTFTLVMGKGIPWQDALGVVFLSGTFFFILAASGLREKLANAIPAPITTASTAGIGLFIAFIGLKNMGIIVADPATLVALGKFTLPVVLSVVGLILMAIFDMKKIRGGILISIVIVTILGMLCGLVSMPEGIVSMPPSIEPIAFKLNIWGAFKLSLFGSIFSFMFIDLFDSLGFLIACYKEIGLVDKDGHYEGLGKMMFADVSSTIIGAFLGTSTVTTFGESAAGIAAGAKTGLASFVTGILFLLALLITPLVGIVPMFAAAPSLVMVGVFMFKSVKDLDLQDIKIAVPAFITIIFMPLTYSISIGLSFGFISYIIMHAVAREWHKINLILWIIGALSVVNIII
ncbi:MAG: NCS2 family permease [Fusobacterium sp.]|nr:NCS2 family permease [Fusobacterium sp.]